MFVALNGTLSDESRILRQCLTVLGFGISPKQAVRSMTGMGLCDLGSDEQAAVFLREKFPDLRQDTLADFLANNAESHCVTPNFTWGGHLLSVSESRLREFFCEGTDGWERFRAAYPESSGLLEFSRVGLNEELTQALFYAGVTYDAMGGSGEYWLFAHVNGRWEIGGHMRAWIS
jgi:hypothetical protein